MSESINCMNDYNKKLIDICNEKAAVRCSPRALIPSYLSEQLVYPIERCINCQHPLVIERRNQVRSFILAQLSYQFLYGTALLETKFVIHCYLDIINNRITSATEFDKLQALSVIVDESYHAHVAMDYILKVKKKMVSSQ